MMAIMLDDNYLIAFTAMTWIENNISTRIVEARFVTSDFSRFREHPVLKKER